VHAWRGETPSGYAAAFLLLGLPAIGSVAVLLRARRLYPDPRELEHADDGNPGERLGPRYRLYMVGVALVAIGLADWPLLAYHFEKADVFSAHALPIVYSAAMGFDGIVSLLAGLLFDRDRRAGGTGAIVLAGFVVLGAVYAPLAFASSAGALPLAIAGIALWSVTHAATNSIAKAMIAAIVPKGQRGRAYGVYFLVFGVAWWAGSLVLGSLYDRVSPHATGIVAAAALALGAGVILWSGVGVRKRSAPPGNAPDN
jgi:predicted MFS family arabinose efflux permease